MMKRWLEILLLLLSCIALTCGTPPQVDFLEIVGNPPVINIPGQDILVIGCSASGSPLPEYSWKKGGKIIKDKDENGRIIVKENELTVKNLDLVKDSGSYQCLATNTYGTSFKELFIRIPVLGSFPPPNHAKGDKRQFGVVVGKEAILECPPHTESIPLVYLWGKIQENGIPHLYERSQRVFVSGKGDLVFANVLQRDITTINNLEGISCLLYNERRYIESKRYTLRNDGVIKTRLRPILRAHMQPREIAIKDKVKTLTCGATGTPTPQITWFKDGVQVKRINKDRLNFDGYLFRSGGVELDILRPRKLDTANFKCYATNSEGEDWKEGGLSVQFLPEWIKTIKSVTVPLANSHMFNCTAIGLPEPTYEWYKNATLLKTNSQVIVAKNILTLKSATQFDSGMYTCLARNKHGSIITQASVVATAVSPKFITSYQDPYYFYRGRTNTIKCNPRAGPPPTIQWFKDGTRLQTTGRVSISQNGSLHIANVEDNDRGSYKCIATNVAGTESAIANVEVVDATTITVGPQNRTVKEGFSYYILCNAKYDKNLELRIDWYKEGTLIKTFDDRVFLEKRVTEPAYIIIIQNVTFQDRGKWSCHAYTEAVGMISEDWAHGYLMVSAPPEPPNNLHLSNDCSDFGTTLNWQLADDNNDFIRHYMIEYSSAYEDDTDSWYIYNNKAEPGSRTSLVMDKLTPYAHLRFRVRAVNSVGKSKPSLPSDPSKCVTPEAAPKTNPARVRGEAGEPSRLFIVWDPVKKIDQNAPGFKYEVGYRRVGDVAAKWERKNVTNITTRYEVGSAGYFQQYEVYVRSFNKKGSGPLPTTYKVYSGQDKPTSGPTNVRIARAGPTDVEVTWDPASVKEPGNVAGYIFYYWNISRPFRIVVERDRRALPNVNAKNRTIYVGPNGPYQVELANLTAALKYNLVVSAFNSGGEGPWSSTLVFETKETAPDKPHDVSMTIYGDVLHIQWQAPLLTNGRVISYFIETEPITKQVVLDGLEREHYLTGLTPIKYYLVRIRARNRFGPGVYYERRIAVSQPDKPGKPKAPRVKPYDSDSVNVTYRVPGYGGLPTRFRACYKPKEALYFDTEAQVRCVEKTFPNRAWVVVNGLNEIKHEFWTIGVNSHGEGEPSERVVSIPLPFPRFGVRTRETPWYKSSWLVGLVSCTFFLLIVLIVIFYLVKKARGKYAVEPRSKHVTAWNGQSVGDYNTQDPYVDYDTQPLTDRVDSRPPPKYSSQSSLEKKPPSDESLPEADYGEDTKFIEDGSFIGQYGEEKKQEDEKEEEVDYSTFV